MVTLTAVDNIGCLSVYTDTINIYALPDVDFYVDPGTWCEDDITSFNDISSADGTIISWNWTIPGATFINPTTSNSDNPYCSFDSCAWYPVNLEVSDNYGCVNDLDTNIRIYCNLFIL